MTARSAGLFVAAAICEIGGAYLMWQAIKDGRGLLFALAGATLAHQRTDGASPACNVARVAPT